MIERAGGAIARTTDQDEQLVGLWLHGRPSTTQRAYRGDVARFLAHAGKPIAAVTLGDVQGFADSLDHLEPSTRARLLSAVKSLLAFGHRIGALPVNVGAALRLPKLRNRLAERILPEPAVQRIIALEPDPRNRTMLRLAYAGGLRVSELVELRWRDAVARDDAGQVTVFGKGGKTRTVLLTPATWGELVALRGEAGADDPVFASRKGGTLETRQVRRIVLAAAKRAGVEGNVSPHWLRHAHASHALDRGAPVHLVAATLGHSSIATTGRYAHARPSDSSSRYLAV